MLACLQTARRVSYLYRDRTLDPIILNIEREIESARLRGAALTCVQHDRVDLAPAKNVRACAFYIAETASMPKCVINYEGAD